MREYTITINHNRVLSHYVEMYEGDSITFKYDWVDDKRLNWVTEYEGTLSMNRKPSFEGSNVGIHTYVHNLFECVEINTKDCITFNDYLEVLKEVFEDSTIPYKNIYNKQIKRS